MPDFRNLGVMFRIVVLAEVARFIARYAQTGDFSVAFQQMVGFNSFFESALLTILLVLFFTAFWLLAKPYRVGVWLVLLLACVSVLAWQWLFTVVFQEGVAPDYPFVIAMTFLLTLGILGYFNWRHRVLSPALAEARLMALQARIRPHFLFNSLNTVLGLMRVNPQQAERVLENLAELFRSLMADSGTLVTLEREIELARVYAEIEAMRLGSRLTVNWQYQNAPMDALLPPLILQPLLENAVYHGVEPSETGGTVSVVIFLKGDQISLVVRNPCDPGTERRTGNRMALTNIRERLALHFDAEAEMSAYQAGGEFVVQIRMPYKRAV